MAGAFRMFTGRGSGRSRGRKGGSSPGRWVHPVIRAHEDAAANATWTAFRPERVLRGGSPFRGLGSGTVSRHGRPARILLWICECQSATSWSYRHT